MSLSKGGFVKTASDPVVANRDILALATDQGFDLVAGFEPREKYIYTVTRAISARVNQNFDGFPSEELRKAYITFLGKPVFVNHVNDDPTRARGRVVGARFVENAEDKYIEVIQEVNAAKFPKLAKELSEGGLDAVSMGCSAERTICSFCGNEATGMFDMCAHVLNSKGRKLRRQGAGGQMEDVLVYEECRDLGFFELSYVFDPADETAVVSTVVMANKTADLRDSKRVWCDLPGCNNWVKYDSDRYAQDWVKGNGELRTYDYCCDDHRLQYQSRFPAWHTEATIQNPVKLYALHREAFGEIEAPAASYNDGHAVSQLSGSVSSGHPSMEAGYVSEVLPTALEGRNTGERGSAAQAPAGSSHVAHESDRSPSSRRSRVRGREGDDRSHSAQLRGRAHSRDGADAGAEVGARRNGASSEHNSSRQSSGESGAMAEGAVRGRSSSGSDHVRGSVSSRGRAGGNSRLGFGEIEAPAAVDTLRNEGESETDDFHQYVESPEGLSDPDLNKAKELDRREELPPPGFEQFEDEGDVALGPDGNPLDDGLGDQVDENGDAIPEQPEVDEFGNPVEPEDPFAAESFGNPLTDDEGDPNAAPGMDPTDPPAAGGPPPGVEQPGTRQDIVPGEDPNAVNPNAVGLPVAPGGTGINEVDDTPDLPAPPPDAVTTVDPDLVDPGDPQMVDEEQVVDETLDGIDDLVDEKVEEDPDVEKADDDPDAGLFDDPGDPEPKAAPAAPKAKPDDAVAPADDAAEKPAAPAAVPEETDSGYSGEEFRDLADQLGIEEEQLLDLDPEKLIELLDGSADEEKKMAPQTARRHAANGSWESAGMDGYFENNLDGRWILDAWNLSGNTWGWAVRDLRDNEEVQTGTASSKEEAQSAAESAWGSFTANRSASRHKGQSITPRKGTTMSSNSLATRGRVASRGRVADQSRNDQGDKEDTFITQTPPAEPVETGEGEGDAPNSEEQLVARIRRSQLLLKKVREGKKLTAEETAEIVNPELSGTDEQELKGDFDSADPDDGVQETQPKDASRRATVAKRRYRHFSAWVRSTSGKPVQQANSLGELRSWVLGYCKEAGVKPEVMYPLMKNDVVALRKRTAADEGVGGSKKADADAIKQDIAEDVDPGKQAPDDPTNDKKTEARRRAAARRKSAGEVPEEFKEHQFDNDSDNDGETDEGDKKESARARAARRRKMADEKLDVAAPDGRVDVEAPTADTTDDEAQASQYDKGDFGDNAGDDIADPDLSTDQNFAPGEGKKSSRVRVANGFQAVRLAEAYIDAGLDTENEGRWNLAQKFMTMSAATVADRTALLEQVAAVQPARTARKTAGTRGSTRSALPTSLSQATAPRETRVAAFDPNTGSDSDMFL